MESMNSCASLLPSLMVISADFDIVEDILCADEDDHDTDSCERKGKDVDEKGAGDANVRRWTLEDNRANDETLLCGDRPLPKSRIDVDVSERPTLMLKDLISIRTNPATVTLCFQTL